MLNVKVEKKILIEAISNAQKGVTGKTTMPILKGLKIEAKENMLTITGSDVETFIESSIEADIISEGSVVLDSKLFGDIIKKLPNDTIELCSIDDKKVNIKCKKSQFTMQDMDANQYPLSPSLSSTLGTITIDKNIFKDIIKQTSFSISIDEARPILKGLLFKIENKVLSVVGLDGYRMAVKNIETSFDNDIEVVIPGKILIETTKIINGDGELQLSITDKHVIISTDNTRITTRVLEGSYIKYNSLFPSQSTISVTVNVEDFMGMLERTSIMDTGSLVTLNISNSSITAIANSSIGNCTEEIDATINGDPLEIAFNSRYLLDILKVAQSEEIVMNFTTPVSPCVIENKDIDNTKYLVLPVRIVR